jgi:small subunit ribosomal protein S6
MQLKNYETVFILTPVLSEQQTKDAVEKFKKLLVDNGAQIVHDDAWGQSKTSTQDTIKYLNLQRILS